MIYFSFDLGCSMYRVKNLSQTIHKLHGGERTKRHVCKHFCASIIAYFVKEGTQYFANYIVRIVLHFPTLFSFKFGLLLVRHQSRPILPIERHAVPLCTVRILFFLLPKEKSHQKDSTHLKLNKMSSQIL